MTNENLAAAIKQGGADDLIPVLWERVRPLIYQQCRKMFNQYSEFFAQRGLTLDDLRQEGYTVFTEALKGFSEASGYKFTTFLRLPLLKMRDRLLFGVRIDVLNISTSLDVSAVEEEESEKTLLALITDGSQGPEERAEEKSLQSVINAAVDRLGDTERLVIRSYYFYGTPMTETAARLHISKQRIGQIKAAALAKLRNDTEIIALHNAMKS